MTTREKVIAQRTTHPNRSMAAIASEVGVSRERVRQILKEEGMVTDPRPKHYCRCGKQIPVRPSYCSTACQQDAKQERLQAKLTTLVCTICQQPFQLNAKRVIYQRAHFNKLKGGPTWRGRFCSKTCQGKHIGQIKAARQRAKTHCPQGHEYTPDNTYQWKRGRTCRACQAERSRKKRLASIPEIG